MNDIKYNDAAADEDSGDLLLKNGALLYLLIAEYNYTHALYSCNTHSLP